MPNKVPLPGGPGARRRNGFIRRHYQQAARDYGNILDRKIQDDLLKLIAYSILVYEDYARPPAIRQLERLKFWKQKRTTGVMQVAATEALKDEESVERGAKHLASAWKKHASEDEDISTRVWSTIGDYNRDSDYISKVMDVMEIIAKQVEPTFKPAYHSIWPE